MIRVAAGILARGDRVLICRRRKGGAFPLKWEFPGGKLQDGETPEAALVRELAEELGIFLAVDGLECVQRLRHRYPGGADVEIHFFRVGPFAGEPTNLAFEEVAWVPRRALPDYDFLAADRPLVARLAAGELISARSRGIGGPPAARE